MTGMGWSGYRTAPQNFSARASFPSLQQAHCHPSSNGHQSISNKSHQASLRPAIPVIQPCEDSDEARQRNSTLIAKMKQMAKSAESYKQFKDVSRTYLAGNGVKASDFLFCFSNVFGGLNSSSQTILEELIALLPDERKRQALHLVYRHEVDRLRSNSNRYFSFYFSSGFFHFFYLL